MTASETTTLEAMLEQESVYYRNVTPPPPASSCCSSSTMKQAVATLETIYELLSLQDRETLVIATYYLHQYYRNKKTASSAYTVSHIALVCFYMAVKIHQTTALPMKSLSNLHDRFFTHSSPSSWESVEMDVCMTLQWRLHPPLATAFLTTAPRRHRKRALTLLDQAFRSQPCAYVGYRPSHLAAAALRSPTAPSEAVAFLQSSQTQTVMVKRKRCVTPPMLSHHPAKKQRVVGPASLRWTGSPRSAALLVEEEESF
ncbi:expressed unknown protein [Seminavis robusta]|uniref:Cyclin N-terminal domain-containing protein n=1 Tax=Seminavis robusta TaxID=568900 RepID=A0A9N8HCB2_9STRA|nr:expressed unknown protein [Seminavis robusta]|eukprot:Sro374_g129250.1 n/a (257) ;mRNA; r:30443-31213